MFFMEQAVFGTDLRALIPVSYTHLDVYKRQLYAYEDVRVKRLDIALDELYKGYGHEDEHIQIPKLIDKLYAKEIVLDLSLIHI